MNFVERLRRFKALATDEEAAPVNDEQNILGFDLESIQKGPLRYLMIFLQGLFVVFVIFPGLILLSWPGMIMVSRMKAPQRF